MKLELGKPWQILTLVVIIGAILVVVYYFAQAMQ